MGINTFLVKGHTSPDKTYNAVVPPVYLSTTFHHEKFEEHPQFGYSRGANPTRTYFEELVASLEGGRYGFAFSSGMTATSASLSVLKTGDNVLVTRNVYGGTHNLLTNVLSNFGISHEFIDTSDLSEVERKFSPNTRAVFVETPSNPLLDVADIAGVSEIAHRHNAITIVDNTFLSPYLQKPLELGADIVVESATKFISGHSDVISGVAVTSGDELSQKIGTFQRAVGGIAQPFDIFLLIRGLKTLSVRIDRQLQNAEKVVDFLGANPATDKIYYPGLKDHPGYEINRRQSKSPGSLVSFELNGNYDIAAFFDSLRVIVHGASLGSVETLIQNPATGSQRGFTVEQRRQAGIKDNLIRLSVGIEDVTDIIEDLSAAFKAAKK